MNEMSKICKSNSIRASGLSYVRRGWASKIPVMEGITETPDSCVCNWPNVPTVYIITGNPLLLMTYICCKVLSSCNLPWLYL